MKKILIVADDLTGALDSAVAFAERGLKTIALRPGADLAAALTGQPNVIALATGTREVSEAAADQTLRAMVGPLADWPDIVFKKVDSRLKGHVAAECAALAELTGLDEALVAPAIPDFGRMVKDGYLSGHGIATPINIGDVLGTLPCQFNVPDVTTPDDFNRALASVDAEKAMLVGARGLAAVLAATLEGGAQPTNVGISSPLLFAIGSRDPITLEQMDQLDDPRVERLEAPNGACPARVPMAPVVLAQITAGPQPSDSHVVTTRFAQGLARLVVSMAPRTIFASGGETADSLLSQMGTTVLQVLGEVLPGMPASRFAHGGRDLVLITKSGGFGQPDTLRTIAARLR